MEKVDVNKTITLSEPQGESKKNDDHPKVRSKKIPVKKLAGISCW